jgi:hypothetical protein
MASPQPRPPYSSGRESINLAIGSDVSKVTTHSRHLLLRQK